MPTLDYDYCAGVLPYTRFNNNVYFLLGKSRRSGRLITFSGKNSEFDATREDTAAREFFEETLGSVIDRNTTMTLLQRCETVLESRTPRGQPCYTYVVEIPFRKHYALCFTKTRGFLEAIQMRGPEYLEMVDIKWVCARTMLIKIRKQWEKFGTLTSTQEWSKLERICNLSADTLNWRAMQDDDDSDIGSGTI
jgi:8-oxo-dGTP pyrophosphatase MutT (NUDIX family)